MFLECWRKLEYSEEPTQIWGEHTNARQILSMVGFKTRTPALPGNTTEPLHQIKGNCILLFELSIFSKTPQETSTKRKADFRTLWLQGKSCQTYLKYHHRRQGKMTRRRGTDSMSVSSWQEIVEGLLYNEVIPRNIIRLTRVRQLLWQPNRSVSTCISSRQMGWESLPGQPP